MTEIPTETVAYHFYCPADGDRCDLRLEDADNDSYRAVCPSLHGWLVTLAPEYALSDDGTAIFGFQCGMTHISAMQDDEVEPSTVDQQVIL